MIIIAQRFGQLANRLILYSHLIAFAQEHDLTVVNLAFEEYAPLFRTTQRGFFCRYPAPMLPVVLTSRVRDRLARLTMRTIRFAERKRLPFVTSCRLADDQEFVLDSAFAEIARRRIVIIGGWLFRKPSGIAESAPTLRAYFRPKTSVLRVVGPVVQKARAGHDLLIGVHLRLGDYKNYTGGRYFYTPEQYARLIVKTAGLFAPRRVAFLLCSDEPPDPASFAGLPVTFGPGDLAGDLYALAKCDFLIGPPSTFTVWASFYGTVPLCHVFEADMTPTREDFRLDQEWGRFF